MTAFNRKSYCEKPRGNTDLELGFLPRYVVVCTNLSEHIPQLGADSGFVHGLMDFLWEKDGKRHREEERSLFTHRISLVEQRFVAFTAKTNLQSSSVFKKVRLGDYIRLN